jgi:hypothetical protein
MNQLIQLLVFAIVAFVAVWVVRLLPLPAPLDVIALLIVGLVLLLSLLRILGVWKGGPPFGP